MTTRMGEVVPQPVPTWVRPCIKDFSNCRLLKKPGSLFLPGKPHLHLIGVHRYFFVPDHIHMFRKSK